MPSHSHAALLTGDIVASRHSTPQALTAFIDQIKVSCPPPLMTDRHRGDGWQVLVPDAAQALDTALRLRADLRATGTTLTTRIAIGIGPAHVPSPPDLGAGHGLAFEASGEALNQMPRGTTLAIDTSASPALSALVGLLDFLSSGWTKAQAAVLAKALGPTPPTQDEIAKALGITRQAVQQHLRATGYHRLQTALAAARTEITAQRDATAYA